MEHLPGLEKNTKPTHDILNSSNNPTAKEGLL